MLSLMLSHILLIIFFYNDTATTNIYPLSLHDALPIFERPAGRRLLTVAMNPERLAAPEEVSFLPALTLRRIPKDRKSTRLNSSHSQISYAVFCLKKKKDRVGTSNTDLSGVSAERLEYA